MSRIPKTEPRLACFFLLLCIAGLTMFCVGIALFAASDVLKHLGRVFHEILWVLV